jgi:hypothetical protein
VVLPVELVGGTTKRLRPTKDRIPASAGMTMRREWLFRRGAGRRARN